jgi:hypothetical protein
MSRVSRFIFRQPSAPQRGVFAMARSVRRILKSVTPTPILRLVQARQEVPGGEIKWHIVKYFVLNFLFFASSEATALVSRIALALSTDKSSESFVY